MGRGSIYAKIFDNSYTRRRFSKVGVFYHDVQDGDSLESLSARYKVSEEDILNANFGMRSTLSGGYQRIIIPLPDAPEEDVNDDQEGNENEAKVEGPNRGGSSRDVMNPPAE
ncbi:hypothetical protein ACHAXT_001793 [Thalassiosira profunda]